MAGIEIHGVTKRFGDVKALDDVTVTFEPEKIYGFLGRNGAGKSTLINIIANRLFADGGSILIDGTPAAENMGVHDKIFCMSEADLYDDSMRIRDIFKWTGRFYDNFDIDKALEISKKFELDTGKRFKTLSKGYQSIFKLTVALSLNVPYLIFDEPVLGLDANHREMFYDIMLREYAQSPRTIIIATHLIEEVSGMIEDVVLIDSGKILFCEEVEKLMEESYCVAGLSSQVDDYCRGKEVVGTDQLGALKQAYIIGEREKIAGNDSLQFSQVNLQKLFIKLTEKGGESI